MAVTFTTQEGDVFDMAGGRCPRCAEPSKLEHRHGVSGYFNCPDCRLMYDEPVFGIGSYITTEESA